MIQAHVLCNNDHILEVCLGTETEAEDRLRFLKEKFEESQPWVNKHYFHIHTVRISDSQSTKLGAKCDRIQQAITDEGWYFIPEHDVLAIVPPDNDPLRTQATKWTRHHLYLPGYLWEN